MWLEQDCLALGAIFATTDSVAVLQVLEQDRAPLLFSFVFGEGVINDATTVALLRTVQVRARGSVAWLPAELPAAVPSSRLTSGGSKTICYGGGLRWSRLAQTFPGNPQRGVR